MCCLQQSVCICVLRAILHTYGKHWLVSGMQIRSNPHANFIFNKFTILLPCLLASIPQAHVWILLEWNELCQVTEHRDLGGCVCGSWTIGTAIRETYISKVGTMLSHIQIHVCTLACPMSNNASHSIPSRLMHRSLAWCLCVHCTRVHVTATLFIKGFISLHNATCSI